MTILSLNVDGIGGNSSSVLNGVRSVPSNSEGVTSFKACRDRRGTRSNCECDAIARRFNSTAVVGGSDSEALSASRRVE